MSNTHPSFFQVLGSLDFPKILRLPPAFVKKYERDRSGNKELRSHCGKKWKVKMQRMEKGLFCFTKGWQKFAEEADLELGEFLFFTRVSQSEFVVQIFTNNFCERQIPPPSLSFVKLNPHALPKPGNDDVVGRPIYFKVCLNDCHKSGVYVPKKFAVAAKLNEKREVRLELVSRHGGTSVVVRLRNKNKRTHLLKGWPQFRTVNRLAYGKTYSFEFKPKHNVIHVKKVI